MNRVFILRSGWGYKPIPEDDTYEAYVDDIRFTRLYAFRERFKSSVPANSVAIRRFEDGEEVKSGFQPQKKRTREPVVLRPMPSVAQEHLLRQYIADQLRVQELLNKEGEKETMMTFVDEMHVDREQSLWRVFDCSPRFWEAPAMFVVCTILMLFGLIYLAAWLDVPISHETFGALTIPM